MQQFVDKGGKLLLVSDPTRPNRINALAKRFGVEFQPDYLYNTVEYDLNFRHIFCQGLPARPPHKRLGFHCLVCRRVNPVFRSGIAVSDTNTKSSLGETAESFYPIALGSTSNVLAIADFTFVVPPYNSLLSNNRLLSNVTDYLTDGQREFDLADFPYFYEPSLEDSIDIVLGQPSLWNIGLEMRTGLSDYGLSSRISGEEDLSRNMVFLGLYEDSRAVSQYLQAAGISADDVLSLPFAPGTSTVKTHRLPFYTGTETGMYL